MLDGKKLLITGVVTRDSIAYHVAERAQRSGAEVALTGFGQEEDRLRSNEAGFQAHLVKPLDPAILRELLLQTQGRK